MVSGIKAFNMYYLTYHNWYRIDKLVRSKNPSLSIDSNKNNLYFLSKFECGLGHLPTELLNCFLKCFKMITLGQTGKTACLGGNLQGPLRIGQSSSSEIPFHRNIRFRWTTWLRYWSGILFKNPHNVFEQLLGLEIVNVKDLAQNMVQI